MEFQLSDEKEMVVETVRAFVEKELIPHEEEVERTSELSDELRQQIRKAAMDAGLWAANMPEEIGGGGLDTVTHMLLERELGRTNLALHWEVYRPSNILQACKGEQVEEYLLPCVRGERFDCFAMSEPDAGSDVRGIATRAVRDGDDWIINGSKHFASYADVADFMILFVATGVDETPRGPRSRISAFLVDKGTAGFTWHRGSQAVGLRGFHHCELFFDDCRVPASKMLGDEGEGFELANTWLSAGRVGTAANSVGKARRALEIATEWAATRKQFGQSIGRFQGISFKLADMATELEAAELLMFRAAWKHDQGTMTDQDAAMAKLYCSEMLGRVTDEAVQIFGGMGLVSELPLERMWRDARIERIWEGTSEIQRHIIGRMMLRPHEQRAGS